MSVTALQSVHEVVADLLLDDDALQRWRGDPRTFAAQRVPDGPARELIATLDPDDVDDAAHNMRHKEAELEPADRPRRSRPALGRTAPHEPAALAPRPTYRPALGVGMRLPMLEALFEYLDRVDVWEHIIDWYVDDDAGSAGVDGLRAYATTAPVAMHSLALSVGGFGCLDDVERLSAVRRLLDVVGAEHLSDHLALSHVGDRRLPHFVPLWRVQEQVELVVANVDGLQSFLGVRLLLENPAQIFDPGGDRSTAAFLNEVTARTGCGVLLDLENLRVNQENQQLDVEAELAELDLSTVVEVHIAGGTRAEAGEPAGDTHDRAVPPEVFGWLAELLPRLEHCERVILERDARFDQHDEIRADVEALHDLLSQNRRT